MANPELSGDNKTRLASIAWKKAIQLDKTVPDAYRHLLALETVAEIADLIKWCDGLLGCDLSEEERQAVRRTRAEYVKALDPAGAGTGAVPTFYDRLSIPSDADERTIESCIRRLSVRCHPGKKQINQVGVVCL